MAIFYVRTVGGSLGTAATYSQDATLKATGAASATLPTSVDDISVELDSGNVTNGVVTFRHLTFTEGWTGSLSTAGSNVNLTCHGNITYSSTMTVATTISGTMNFVGGVAQSLDAKGLLVPWNNLLVNHASTTLSLLSPLNAGGTITVTSGNFVTNSHNVECSMFNSSNSNLRTLDLGTSVVTITGTGTAWNTAVSGDLTLIATQSTIRMTGASGTFDFGNLVSSTQGDFGTVELLQAGSATIGGGSTVARIANLTRVPNVVSSDAAMRFTTTITVTGSVTLAAFNRESRLLIASSSLGSARVLSAATVALGDDVSFRDVDFAGTGWAAHANTGTVRRTGDAQGNLNAPAGMFAASRALHAVNPGGSITVNYWYQAANWSLTVDGAGGEGPPLPQDDVLFDQTVTGRLLYVPTGIELCRDLTLVTNGVRLQGNPPSIYGSLTLTGTGPLIDSSSTTTRTLQMLGQANRTITSNGAALGQPTTNPVSLSITGPTVTLADALSVTGALAINSALVTAGMSVTCSSLTMATSGTRSLDPGTSTVTLTGTGTIWYNNDGVDAGAGWGQMTVDVVNTSGTVRNISNERGTVSKFGRLRYTVNGGALVLGNTASRGYQYTALEVAGTSELGAPKRVILPSTSSTLVVDEPTLGTADSYVYLESGGSGRTLTMPAGTSLPYVHLRHWAAVTNPLTVGGGVSGLTSANITQTHSDWPQLLDAQVSGTGTAVTVRAFTPATAVAVDDVLLLTGYADTTAAPTPPSGFVEVAGPVLHGGTTTPLLRTYAKKLTTLVGEPATYGLDYGTAVVHSATFAVLRGADDLDAAASVGDFATGNNVSSYTSPATATTRPRSVVMRTAAVVSGDRPASSQSGGFTVASVNATAAGNALSLILSYAPTAGTAPVEHGSYTTTSANSAQSLVVRSNAPSAVPVESVRVTSWNVAGAPRRARLTWDAPASDGGSPVLDYRVERKRGVGAFEVISTPTQPTYLDEAAQVGDQYQVAARNAVGLGPFTAVGTYSG